MNISDYTIGQEGLPWSTMLQDWNWILPDSFEIWIVTRFADLFIVLPDRTIALLDTGAGRLQTVADSKEYFAQRCEDLDTFCEWFLVGAVDQLVEAERYLAIGQCYSFKLPPGLGGDYTMDNYMVTDVQVHLSLHGQIFRQTKDLPDGTRVTFSEDEDT